MFKTQEEFNAAVETKIAEMIAGGKFFKKGEPEPKPDPNPEPKPEPKKDASTLEQARLDAEAKAQQNSLIAETEAATKFELGFDKMKTDYADFMPKETDSIINVVKNQKHENSVAKVRETKVALLDSFFQIQKNIDVLNESMKEKVLKYKDLTQDAKRLGVTQYWEVFEVALDNLKAAQKTEQALKANGNRPNATGAEAEYNEKIFKKAEFYMGGKK